MFGASAIAKARMSSHRRFATSLGRFGVPFSLRREVAAAVVAVETALALLLIVPTAARLASLVSVAVLAVFSAALADRLRSGDRAPCLCFGGSARNISAATLARNGLAILVGAIGALSTRSPAIQPMAVLAVAGVIAGFMLVYFEEITSLIATPKSLPPR